MSNTPNLLTVNDVTGTPARTNHRHSPLLLLLLLEAVLLLHCTLTFTLLSSIYLLLLLNLTPVTFSLPTPTRKKSITRSIKTCKYYAGFLTLSTFLSQFLPLLLPLPPSNLRLLSLMGITFYPSPLSLWSFLSIGWPHVAIAFISDRAEREWSGVEDRREGMEFRRNNGDGGTVEEGEEYKRHGYKQGEEGTEGNEGNDGGDDIDGKCDKNNNSGNNNNKTGVLKLYNTTVLHKTIRTRIHHISPLWLTMFMCSLSLSGSLNPSIVTAPYYCYALGILTVHAIRPGNVSFVLNVPTLSCVSMYSVLVILATYVWQFSELHTSGNLTTRHFGIVRFSTARETGHYFEYFHVFSVWVLQFMASGKVIAWTRGREEYESIGSGWGKDKVEVAWGAGKDKKSEKTGNARSEFPPTPLSPSSSSPLSSENPEVDDYNIFKTARHLKQSLGISKTATPQLDRNLKTFFRTLRDWLGKFGRALKKFGSLFIAFLKSSSPLIILALYTTLALERHTVLGFVFCMLVFAGSIAPGFVFKVATPYVLMYTVMYSVARFIYASLTSGFPSTSLGDTGKEIGLDGMDAYDYGWLSATSLVFAVFTLAVCVRVNRRDTQADRSGMIERNPSVRRGTSMPTPLSKYATFYHSFESLDGLRYVCLAICAGLGMRERKILNLGFLAFAWIFTSTRKLSSKLWLLLVLYLDLYILVQYFCQFSVLDNYRSQLATSDSWGLISEDSSNSTNGTLIMSLAVPFFLHVLVIRQLRIYKQRGATKREYFAAPIENAPLIVKISLTSTVLGFCILLVQNAFTAPMSAVTGGYFWLLLMPPLLTCLSSASSFGAEPVTEQPASLFSQPNHAKPKLRNMFWLLYKLTCFYAGSVVFLREAVGVEIVSNWTSTQSWYSVHFGLDSDTTSALPHVFLIVFTILLDVLSSYLPALFFSLSLFTTLSPIQRLVPFLMGFSCFYAAISSVSLAGSVVLVTSLILLVSKDRVRKRVWRGQGVASFIFAITSFAFQFPFFNFMATPGAFWYGLKRAGSGIPDPFTNQEVEADTGMLEQSIWGYALCTWAAGVYGMVCGSGEGVSAVGRGGTRKSSAFGSGVEMIERMIQVSEESHVSDSDEAPTESQRKHTLYQDADWGGSEGDVFNDDDMIFFDAYHGSFDDIQAAEFESRPVSKARLQRASSMRNIKQANASFNFALRGVLRGRFLQLSVLMMFASSLVHSDGVGLIYLTMAVWCYRSSRAKCRRYWVLISTVFLVLLFMQYFAILRLHPALMSTVSGTWSDVFGGSWCGMFKKYSSNAPNGYLISNYLCFCIPEHSGRFLTCDFLTLLVMCYCYVELRDPNLDGREYAFDLEFVTAHTRHTLKSILAFLLFIPLPYINLGIIMLFGSMVYNWITFWYVVLVMRAVALHATGSSNSQGINHIGRDPTLWIPILRFSVFSLFLRLTFQFPYFPESYHVTSWQVQLGLRKVYGTIDLARDDRNLGYEIVVDAVVASLTAFQLLLLERPEIPHVLSVSKYLAPFKHRNGRKIVKNIESERDEAMESIRTKFRQMHDFCVLVSHSREKASEEVKWEQYLLKYRMARSAGIVEETDESAEPMRSRSVDSPSSQPRSAANSVISFLNLSRPDDHNEEERKLQKLEKAAELEKALVSEIANVGIRRRRGASTDQDNNEEVGAGEAKRDSNMSSDGSGPVELVKRGSQSNIAYKMVGEQKMGIVLKAKWHFLNALQGAATDVLNLEEEGKGKNNSNDEHSVDLSIEDVSVASMASKEPGDAEEAKNEDDEEGDTKSPEERASGSFESSDAKNPLHFLGLLLGRMYAFLDYIFTFIRSNSTLFVYSTMIMNHMTSPNFLTIPYPIAVFGYALCFNPRSMPTLTEYSSLFLHPLIQNPHPMFWTIVVGYSGFVICLKLAFQSHAICMCANEFSIAPLCPAMNSSGHIENKQCVSSYEQLPYYNNEPMVKDIWFGLDKAVMEGSRNYVDMTFEPYTRSIVFDKAGIADDEILDIGWGGPFLVSVLGELFVIGSVLFHCEYLRMRGVWNKRSKMMDEAVEFDEDEEDWLDILDDHEDDDNDDNRGDGGITKLPQIRNDQSPSSEKSNDCCKCSPSHKYHCAKIMSTFWKSFKKYSLILMKALLHNSKLLVVTLHDDILRFTNNKGRRKPGSDFYLHILLCQLVQFFFLVFFMQRSDALLSSIQENSISGDYVATLFTHFCIMVMDRCIYLLKSIKFKYLMQIATLTFVLTILHTGALMKSSLSSGGSLFVWFMLEFLYLFFSALQISYGYPPFTGGSIMTTKIHWMYGNIFTVFRAIPFVYEISLILDWACTETTLMIGDWIKLEDINSTLYLVACNLHFLQQEGRRKGEPQPLRRKWLTGALVFVLLCFIVWFPLFVFSTGTMSSSNNPISQVKMTIGLKRYPDLYNVEYEKDVSNMLSEQSWYYLEEKYSQISGLPVSQRAEYRNELQEIVMYPTSGEVWSISPPAWSNLITDLNEEDGDIELVVSYSFLLQTTGTEVIASSEKILTDQEKVDFSKVLDGNRTEFKVEGLIPQFFRVASGNGVVRPLVSDLNTDCVLSMGTLAVNSTGTTTISSENKAEFTDWWNIVCGTCESDNPGSDCDGPRFYTISAKTTFGTYLQGYSILGLYVLVIGTVAGFVRGSFVNTQVTIWMTDLPRVDVLRELLTHLYLSRLHGDLVLEEELYREIIDIYRQPHEMFGRTGLYRHWFREEEEGDGEGGEQNTGEALLLRELERYKD